MYISELKHVSEKSDCYQLTWICTGYTISTNKWTNRRLASYYEIAYFGKIIYNYLFLFMVIVKLWFFSQNMIMRLIIRKKSLVGMSVNLMYRSNIQSLCRQKFRKLPDSGAANSKIHLFWTKLPSNILMRTRLVFLFLNVTVALNLYGRNGPSLTK